MWINPQTGIVYRQVAAIRAAHPNTSMPAVPSDECLAWFGLVPVMRTDPPAYDPLREDLTEEAPIEIEGSWVQTWLVAAKTLIAVEAALTARRLELHTARRAARTRAETVGFSYNGHPFDSDRDSILRIANAATTALTATLLEAPFATEWHCADGYDMPMDAAGVMAMQGALAAHGQACHDRSGALRAMIDAPDADLDALAVEIKTGWPPTTVTEV
jgi:hypothetical protein